MIALYITLGVLAFLILLYLFLIFPHAKSPENRDLLCDYAHRGLHGNGVPENSLAAFELAAKAGFGIELDVQLSADRVVMVFHDETLTRMTGVEKKLSELTAEQLGALSLADSDERIPTLCEVLELVSGRVPILVELKGEATDTTLCSYVADCLRCYEGAYCIESFNPLLLHEMKKHLPDAYYGLLYTNACREKKKYSLVNILVSCMALNFLARPNFIAYSKNYRKALPVLLGAGLFRATRFVWTVNTPEELDEAHRLGELPIFEHCSR